MSEKNGTAQQAQGRSGSPARSTEDKSPRPSWAAPPAGGTLWGRYAVGVFFSVIWSSAFIAGKVVVMEMGPFATLFYRFTLTVLVHPPEKSVTTIVCGPAATFMKV